MACGATLKRSLDFDPLHTTVSSSPTHTSPFVPRTPPNKRRRLSPQCGSVFSANDCRMSSGLSPFASRSPSASPFQASSPISSEKILKNIYDEYKRMKRRRQLQMNQHIPMVAENHDMVENIPSASTFYPPNLPSSSSSQLPDKDKKVTETPMLTMKQVGLICERLLKEQEDKLRTDYDKVLVSKLSEQYDAFVKFNHDQVQRRISQHPASYVS